MTLKRKKFTWLFVLERNCIQQCITGACSATSKVIPHVLRIEQVKFHWFCLFFICIRKKHGKLFSTRSSVFFYLEVAAFPAMIVCLHITITTGETGWLEMAETPAVGPLVPRVRSHLQKYKGSCPLWKYPTVQKQIDIVLNWTWIIRGFACLALYSSGSIQLIVAQYK